jgi:streptogramin lyase
MASDDRPPAAIEESFMRGIGSALVLFVFLSSCDLFQSFAPAPQPPPYGSSDGVGTAAGFTRPMGLGLDADDNIYVADSSNFSIRKITPAAVVTTWAGVSGVDGDAVGSRAQARFWYPEGAVSTPEGVVYVADTLNLKIKKIVGDVVTVFAGSGEFGADDGQGTEASFAGPRDMALDASGNLYLVDASTLLRKIDPSGNVTTVATGFDALRGLTVGSDGNIYGSETYLGTILKITPAGVVTTFVDVDAGLEYPGALAFAPDDSLYVCDGASRQILKISPEKVVTVFAGGAAASFASLEALALDSHGNLFVSEMYRIRKVTPGGLVTTFAGGNGQ